jgi:TRAP-type mannitol/chloroaromatic compound transport system permease small subunit
MTDLKKIIFVIENITLKVGRKISWLILFMTLTAFSVALLRYFFNIGFVWMQESYIWMHGLVFLLGSAYTLLDDKHVRVDIFYRTFSERYKAYVNIFFSIFFIFPFIFIVSKYSIPYILKSWISLEQSREAGGLQFLYLYKTSIILFCFFLFIQTIALILRCVLVINKKQAKIFFKF